MLGPPLRHTSKTIFCYLKITKPCMEQWKGIQWGKNSWNNKPCAELNHSFWHIFWSDWNQNEKLFEIKPLLATFCWSPLQQGGNCQKNIKALFCLHDTSFIQKWGSIFGYKWQKPAYSCISSEQLGFVKRVGVAKKFYLSQKKLWVF